ITRHIVSAVGAEVDRAQVSAVGRIHTNDLKAQELGLRAWAQVRDIRTRPDEASTKASVELARKALGVDEQCVPALLALAHVSWLEAFFRIGPESEASLAKSIELARKVENIDHLNHEPRLIKTYAYLTMTRHGDALFEAERALELNPNDPA